MLCFSCTVTQAKPQPFTLVCKERNHAPISREEINAQSLPEGVLTSPMTVTQPRKKAKAAHAEPPTRY